MSPFMNSLYDYAQGEDFPTIDSSTVKKVQVSENKDSYVLEENSDGATWDVSGDGTAIKSLPIQRQQECNLRTWKLCI